MIILPVALTILLLASLAAHFVPTRWRWLGALLMQVPLLLVALLYWQGSRGGCAGGECGPAMMMLGLLGILALMPAAFGAVFLLQAVLGALAGLAGERGRTRGVRWMLTLLPFLLAITAATIATHSVLAQPSEACRTKAFVASIAGDRVRLPFGKQVTIVRGGGGELALSDTRDAQLICATAGVLDARSIKVDSDWFFGSSRSADPRTRLIFGEGAYSSRISICDGPLGTTAKPMFCPRPRSRDDPFFAAYSRQQVTVQSAGVAFRPPPFFAPRPPGVSGKADADAAPVLDRLTAGAFAVEMKEGGWIMRSGDTAGDPLGLPRVIAYCRPSQTSGDCRVRQRLSPRVAATATLNIAPARTPADVLPTLAQLSAFLASLTPPEA